MRANQRNRRDVLGLLGGGLGALGAGGAWAAEGPDLIVTGANVYTVDPGRPRVQAFAVKGGRFVAVGSNAEIKAFAGAGVRTLDAGGATI
ncbi:MAG: amidohydrolase, partial [Proteobacteria bacterium]|nr:amidohydrolase [Pseudomonadota bacterium]